MFPTHRQTQLSFRTIGTRKSCARYKVKYKGKNAFVCTSKAYAHSTVVSAGFAWDGGESKNVFEMSLLKDQFEQMCNYTSNGHIHHMIVAIASPTNRKSRNII